MLAPMVPRPMNPTCIVSPRGALEIAWGLRDGLGAGGVAPSARRWFYVGRIFCGKPVPTFPENAPRRARIPVEGGNAMPEIKTELLFKIVLEVPSILDLGETPYGRRRIARVGGGTFEGPKMKGRVLDGGGDWLLLRRDGVLQLDVRQTLETDDKQHIYMTY